MATYIQVLSKIKSSIGLGLGILLIGSDHYILKDLLKDRNKKCEHCEAYFYDPIKVTGIMGIVASRSRLRLYTLMISFGHLDFKLLVFTLHKSNSYQSRPVVNLFGSYPRSQFDQRCPSN